MTFTKLIIAGIATGAIIAFASVVQPVQRDKPALSIQPSFDHSGCQYPDRSTNPPGGCDNSDPCDPANVKGGSGDCIKTVKESTAVIRAEEYDVNINFEGK